MTEPRTSREALTERELSEWEREAQTAQRCGLDDANDYRILRLIAALRVTPPASAPPTRNIAPSAEDVAPTDGILMATNAMRGMCADALRRAIHATKTLPGTLPLTAEECVTIIENFEIPPVPHSPQPIDAHLNDRPQPMPSSEVAAEPPASAPQETLSTECCDKSIQPDQRYCPRCGWEARVRDPLSRAAVCRWLDERIAYWKTRVGRAGTAAWLEAERALLDQEGR